ncbi:MAG TPA: 30S ribosomal protein S16 [Acidimicrobiia bacterium]|nr:30S ribosomal protein S16 [Acidimicrobiia bacterium]
MSVKIRLMRMGKSKQPSYRVVVADSRSPRDGRNIETIGHYGPRQDPSLADIDGEKALAWLRKGAQPTEQVQKLLMVTGVWAQFESEKGGPVDTKLARRRLGDPKAAAKKEEVEQAEQAQPEAPAPEATADEAGNAGAPAADAAAESGEEPGDE